MTIKYLKGGGIESNVPANSITNQKAVTITTTDNTYQGTLTFSNNNPATGGKDGDTVEELRQNSLRAFSEQKRAVTLDDYTVRSLSLPSQFGSIAKSFTSQATQDNKKFLQTNNPLDLNLYVLGYDNEKKLTKASTSLKNNLREYLSLYKMITDSINILDAFVINIKVKFEIVTLPNYNSRDVLLNCNTVLKNYFDITKWAINQPINLSELYTLLDRVKGVQTVKTVEVTNLAGGNYSEYEYDSKGATKDNVVYPSYDPSIFEVKYPNQDIEGRVITLEFEKFFLLHVYTPNSGQALKRLDYRVKTWDVAFRKFVKSLNKTKPIIVTGDLNVAHQEIDIHNPKGNLKNSGFTIVERESFDKLLNECELIDSYRELNKNKEEYSFWTYLHQARKKNKGWRIDYFLVSKNLLNLVKKSEILTNIMGSDHAPVMLKIKL